MVDYDKVDRDEVQRMLDEVLHGGFNPPSEDYLRAKEGLPELSQKEMNIVKGLFYKAAQAAPRVNCMAPCLPPCRERPISSHTIPESGALRFLADETNHVGHLTVRFSLEYPRPAFKPVGVGEATTFPGLCACHDHEIFKEIDVFPLRRPSCWHMFLLSYRSMLRQRHRQRCMLESFKSALDVVEGIGGCTEEVKAFCDQMMGHSELVDGIGKYMKDLYDQTYRRKSHERDLCYFAARIHERVHFATSCFVAPTHDLQGRLFGNGGWDEPWSWLTMDVVPDEKGATIVVVHPRVERDIERFSSIIKDLNTATHEGTLHSLAWRMAMKYAETVVVRRSAWEAFDESLQEGLLAFWCLRAQDRSLTLPKLVPVPRP